MLAMARSYDAHSAREPSARFEHLGEPQERTSELVIRWPAEPDREARSRCAGSMMRLHTEHPDRCGIGDREHPCFIDVVGDEPRHDVQSRCAVPDPQPWCNVGEHLAQLSTALPVSTAHLPNVPIELATLDEVGEDELVERGHTGADVGDTE
jgi:hypothetical protein